MDLNHFTANWHYPTAIRAGIGRIQGLPDACKELGMTSPLLITDPGLAELPMVQDALVNCQQAGLKLAIFSQIKGNPTGDNVSDGVRVFKRGEHDGVIAFGGGSALDAGKAVALMVGQDRPIWDFEDVGDNWLNVNTAGMVPVVAVPTTSGTGSEVGRASVITDNENHIKRIIFHPNMLPDIVILDPQLSVGLPSQLTAATGMDALSHALEAYCANGYHPMAEGIALEAIRLIKEYLPRAVEDGFDLEARTQMMTASTMGSTAFQRGLGGMHALAHPIGALYDSHHGLLNAILMPYVLKANRDAIEDKLSRLSRYIELEDTDFDGFLDWVLTLRKQLDIPHSLGEIGIDADRVVELGAMASQDPSAGGNPIILDAQAYADICLSAVHGDL
ncbi:iron-containing alcohol dehydrogenase [Moritella sp. F3]|uniref:iron-containing alcohol dehydrogenase n=1 Tax=Moritella sp. F3 TaxID=2718882 RepID=UPI0018E12316|nr:iron-containing alcohol dehydrogenase [Moritella sp. F3]GIC76909.1 alcohol dehydrogenase [Moritella sp. F1]GIC80092.1 alcohol dehydrogenase [Moritella sp. F3]